MSRALTIFLFGAAFTLTGAHGLVPAVALEFEQARELQEYGQTIAIKRNQRVVMYEAKRSATSVLVVLDAPLQDVAPILRELARGRFGESAWRDREQSDAAYWEKRHGPAPEERDRRIRQLQTARVVVGNYREITFESNQYNILRFLGWTRGYSRLTLWLMDGRSIFGRPSTLLRVQRRDEVYAWAWAFHVNPIPSFHRQGARFVTEEELELLPELARSEKAAFESYPEINYSYSLLDSAEQLMRAAKWLRSHR
jgi:hypothetical protein